MRSGSSCGRRFDTHDAAHGPAMTPKISVCVPTYNYARYLPEAIGSVLGQSLPDFELLIIDDASTDDTRRVVEGSAGKDPRIDFRVNPVNLGMVENWNLCLRGARGTYVKFLFGDDLLASPEALRRMAAILDADPSVSLVASARNVIDETSRVKAVRSHFPDGLVVDGPAVIRRCLVAQENLIGEPSAVMFRRDQAARGFDPRYSQFVDLEMWLHLLEKGRFAYLREPLCSFREHPEQRTRSNLSSQRQIEDSLLLLADYLRNPGKPPMDIGDLEMAYLAYDPAYQYWKEYRSGRIGREEALRRIRPICGLPAFFLRYPFHKVYKELRRAWRRRVSWRSCP